MDLDYEILCYEIMYRKYPTDKWIKEQFFSEESAIIFLKDLLSSVFCNPEFEWKMLKISFLCNHEIR